MSGTYALLDSFGKGVGSEVYLVRHVRLKQYRIIKSISKKSKESELLCLLSHPGIPTVYDCIDTEEGRLIIEEYKGGDGLDTYLGRQRKISKKIFFKIGFALSDITGYLHALSSPVLYLNWSLRNIRILGEEISLTDYSAAIYSSDAKEAEEILSSLDEEAVRPPELKKNRRCQKKTDIYGLGSILLQIKKYVDDSSDESDPLYSLILSAVSEDPERRPDARVLRSFFERALREEEGSNENDRCFHRRIAVLGSESGVGATHFSISICGYLNHLGKTAVMPIPGLMKKQLEKYERTAVSRGDTVKVCAFTGILNNTLQNEYTSDAIIIYDMGIFQSWNVELEDCDLIFPVLGGRAWETEAAISLADRLRYTDKIKFIVSYGNFEGAKRLGRMIKRDVAVFPTDSDPFSLNKEKLEFFKRLKI